VSNVGHDPCPPVPIGGRDVETSNQPEETMTETTADAWATWADIPAQERHDWRASTTSRGELCYWLAGETRVSITAVPYVATVHDANRQRYQVYVLCGCPGSGMHAFPVDDLDDAARQGLTVCARTSRGAS